ncbi:hypothetical protein ACTFIT_009933 [Dictyostelium discoideum]
MKFSELEKHIQNCESRILQCNLCLVKFFGMDSEKHQNECPKVFLKCEFCNTDIIRSSLSDHHKTYYTKTKHLNDDCEEIMIFVQNIYVAKVLREQKDKSIL